MSSPCFSLRNWVSRPTDPTVMTGSPVSLPVHPARLRSGIVVGERRRVVPAGRRVQDVHAGIDQRREQFLQLLGMFCDRRLVVQPFHCENRKMIG